MSEYEQSGEMRWLWALGGVEQGWVYTPAQLQTRAGS